MNSLSAAHVTEDVHSELVIRMDTEKLAGAKQKWVGFTKWDVGLKEKTRIGAPFIPSSAVWAL